jgi:metabolite-proton symporter
MASVTSQHRPGHSRSMRKVAAGSLVGTSLEFYDHFIFGSAAAVVFPRLFFPEGNLVLATILSLTTYGVAFVARPLGALIFGALADKMGRRKILVITLMIMGGATFLIGLLPPYAAIGVAAPILLVVLRVAQGIALGGEWGGAALMVNEFDPEGHRRGFFGSLVQVASPIGVLLANAVLATVTWIVSEDAFFSWGWRIPFLLSAVLVIVGLWIRMQVEESPVYRELSEQGEVAEGPISEAVRNHWRRILVAIGSRAGEGVIWYIFSLFLLVYATQRLGLPSSLGFTAQMAGAVVGLVSVPAFGALSDRLGRRPVIIGGAVGAAVWLFAYFPLLGTRNPLVIVLAASVGMMFQAALWGPLASFIPELFPTRVRATAAGFGFQMAGVVGGATIPIIAVWLLNRFDNWLPVAGYAVFWLALVVVAVAVVPESLHKDLRTDSPAGQEPAPSTRESNSAPAPQRSVQNPTVE